MYRGPCLLISQESVGDASVFHAGDAVGEQKVREWNPVDASDLNPPHVAEVEEADVCACGLDLRGDARESAAVRTPQRLSRNAMS